MQDLRTIIDSVCRIVGPNGKPPLTPDSLDQHTQQVFKVPGPCVSPTLGTKLACLEKLDLDGDGLISEEEFLNGCLADPVIMKSIAVFETVF